jgi:hypothetical protein
MHLHSSLPCLSTTWPEQKIVSQCQPKLGKRHVVSMPWLGSLAQDDMGWEAKVGLVQK